MTNGAPSVCMVAYTEYADDSRVRREAETLASHGFRVRCLVLRTGRPDTPRRFQLDGVEIHELPVRKYQGKATVAYLASYLTFAAAASIVCARMAAGRALDVVHVHNLPDFLVAAGLMPRLLGCKVVLDVHDSMPETFATKFGGRPLMWRLLCGEERWSTRFAHKVICVNHPQRDTLVSRGLESGKTFVSLNSPDPRIFATSARHRAAATADTLELVYHGTMARRLGVDLVIRSLARVREQVPGARLHLWGRGDDLREFQSLVRTLRLNDCVSFEPAGVPLEELPGRLQSMHVGVIGNRPTAAGDLMLPVKLLEYVSLGIPVVVPRLRTIQHYFDDEMVTFYEPGDVESMADGIRRLHGAPELRRQQAARARGFLERYGWERQGPEFLRFYQSAQGW